MALPEDLQRTLERKLGAAAVRRERVEVDEQVLSTVIEPSDVAGMSQALAALQAAKVGVVIRGGGTELAAGHPPEGAELVLSTRALSGVLEFDPADGVVQVAAGTPVETLRLEMLEQGRELPLVVRHPDSTLGGVLADAAIGPRSLHFKAPRDVVLGLEVVLASGEVTKCGGRVVKNVTGFDLQKLYVGSRGTLGVITKAWLRLRPRPGSHTVEVCVADLGPDTEHACRAGLEIARRPCAQAVMLTRRGQGTDAKGWQLGVDYQGEEAEVRATGLWLQSRHRAERVPEDECPGKIERMSFESEGCWRSRIDVVPSRIPVLAATLHAAGIDLELHPGLALAFASGQESEAGAGLAAVEAVTRDVGAAFVHERVPTAHKAGRELFDETDDAIAVMRALKQRFDPHRILNPGRVAGRL